MEKEQRNRLQKATQDARRLLEEEFRSQLLETYDINVAAGRWNEEPGTHLQAEQRLIREKLVAWIEHKEAQIGDRKEALLLALREMAFTALNRFVALKLMEARELVRPCVSGGLESEGFQEFTAVAQGLLSDQESSYQLYLETIFEDVSRELMALFDPRDPASLLWPKRTALLDLLEVLNKPELTELWLEDETIGWIYQYFNGRDVKDMRDAVKGGAPRNSRELAVRNQFFTPRYVVEFLTDNTLGRIWYEMRQGNSGLKERCRYLVRRSNEIWLQSGDGAPTEVVADKGLSQEELLQQPLPIPHRPLKDPREIRMLDPACGSMHFGLYAFDLYLAIYAESWEIAQSSDEQANQGEAFASFLEYAGHFADKAAFLREVPRLILQHNIHGIDIDPRATQIARLTLWLRAQRAWQEQQLEAADRLPITRSNVVCAEPMPGEQELLADFVDQQFPEAERGLVQQLLEAVFAKMQLAGVAGSLLKIEEEIREAIDQARREWQKFAVQQRDLFSLAEMSALGQVSPSLNADLQNLTKDFWIDIEESIYTALRDYAEQAESGRDFQRRLFAEDAAQGFAFIDVCRKRYDVALMNPPFGLEPTSITKEIQKVSSSATSDIFATFVAKGRQMLVQDGVLGAITSRAFLLRRRLCDFREEWILPEASLMIDLGPGVMDDAMVESCAFILLGNQTSQCIQIHDWRKSLSSERSATRLATDKPILFPRERAESIPFKRIAYSLPPDVVALFESSKCFEPDCGFAKEGMRSFDDPRFLRLTWEVSPHDIGYGKAWVSYAKGGEASTYFGRQDLVINQRYQGKELDAKNIIVNGSTAQVRQASRYWGKEGCTYSRRSKRFAVRFLPSGSIFSGKGPAIIPSEKISTYSLLAWLNSKPVRALVEMQANASDYYTGIVKTLPVPNLIDSAWMALDSAGKRLLSARRQILWLKESVSHARGILSNSRNIEEGASARSEARRHLATLIGNIEQDVDQILMEGYSMPSLTWVDDIVSVDDGSDAQVGESSEEQDVVDDAVIDDDSLNSVSEENEYCKSIASILVGAIYGRYNIDECFQESLFGFQECPASDLISAPNSSQVFSAFHDKPSESPVCLEVCTHDVFVNSQLSLLDLLTKLIERSWSSLASGVIDKLQSELSDGDLSRYYLSPAGFFSDHLKKFTWSRRQAPLYWLITAGSGSFAAFLYYHSLTKDTIYRLIDLSVDPALSAAQRNLFDLRQAPDVSSEMAGYSQVEISQIVDDLNELKRELLFVAPLWTPNFDDGVIINHAILWRITPYTPWQKKCKDCWDKLVKGDYDWAHLAFHLWPERVIRKCITDRSLAIAHGLEERLWQETNKGNWLQRQISEAELQALIAEHCKPAVQNALERFLAAPPPMAAARTRAPRAAKSSSTGTTRRPRGTATAVDAEASRQTLLVLTAAPAEGLGRNAIADLLDVEAASLTAVIKQLKEGGQIEQLGAARGAKYRLSELGRTAIENQAGEES
jgi:hypothetical protein